MRTLTLYMYEREYMKAVVREEKIIDLYLDIIIHANFLKHIIFSRLY